MIKTFAHKGLQRFYETGSVAGIQPKHQARLSLQLKMLDRSKTVEDMRLPGWNLHPLKGAMKGLWAVKVNGNWRLTFRFEGGHAYVLDYQDYH